MERPRLDSDLQSAFDLIVREVRAAGGRVLLVGGSVRDALLGLDVADLDLEVYGLAPDVLRSVIGRHFGLDLVGHNFGVLKLKRFAIDVAIPRRESKRGLGHKGFEIASDPTLDPAEAAARRDFTVNAIAWDPASGALIDPWGGVADLEARVLRHVSDQFAEDPLRVLRGMQFAARFELEPAASTVALCRTIEPEGLPPERIYAEWKKLILLGRRPSRGLAFLRETGWVAHQPELAALIDCPQDPLWHPEGDVWVHTQHVMDAFVLEKVGDEWEDLVVGFAALCHDFGKPATTHFTEGRWRSPGHEEAGVGPMRRFLGAMKAPHDLMDEIEPLVREHLRPITLFKSGVATAATIRRLANRTGRIDRLVRLCRADHRGRPPLPWDDFPAGHWLLERAAELSLEKEVPRPLVRGRHLKELGLEPGRHFKTLLDACFEAQLDGAFDDLEGGLRYVRDLVGRMPVSGAPGDPSPAPVPAPR